MSEITFEMDQRWDGYSPPFNKKAFKKVSESTVNCIDSVPEIIQRKLDHVKSLLIVSAVDYELQDVAEMYTLIILELALKKKYSELEQKETWMGLRNLLEWAGNENLLELSEENQKFIVGLRNNFAHQNNPEELSGVLASRMIVTLVDLINQLYQN